ncbi:hypothetical protein D3C79_662250 [compost metagenome]
MFQQFVDKFAVEADPGFVHLSPPLRQQPRPGDRKSIGLHAQFGHQRHVFPEAMIVIDRHVAVGALIGSTGQMGKQIPVGQALAVGIMAALNLIRRGRRAPEEIHWKYAHAFCTPFCSSNR